jgi:hypothetical protein
LPDPHSDRPDHDPDDRRPPYAGLAALVLIAVLLAAGLFLAQKLREMSALQDCVMSGRTNCAPISADGK